MTSRPDASDLPTVHPAEQDACEKHKCLLAASGKSYVQRAQSNKIDVWDLERLVELVHGRCMVCAACHAQVVDSSRSASPQVRGVVCRMCRTRLSEADGAVGNLMGWSSSLCRCDPRTPEWRTRMDLSTTAYLGRAKDAHLGYADPRSGFTELVRRVETDGLDPSGVWRTTDAEARRLAAAQAGAHLLPPAPEPLGSPPLERPPCDPLCDQHACHVYICCFDVPTWLRDRDYYPADVRDYPLRHYVGFTSQHPPVKRVKQHGAEALRGLKLVIPGTQSDEAHLKQDELCPSCGQALWYFEGAPGTDASAPG